MPQDRPARGQPSFQASPGCCGISERKLGAKFCQPEAVKPLFRISTIRIPRATLAESLRSLSLSVFLFQRCYGVAMAKKKVHKVSGNNLPGKLQDICSMNGAGYLYRAPSGLPALGFLSYKRCYKYL